MGFTRLEFEKSWTNSKDFPTYEDSEQQVRADMQYHPDAIRDYLNQSFIAELEGENGAAYIGSARGESLQASLEKVDEKLADIDQAIIDLAVGEPPEAVRAARIDFSSGDWASPEAGAAVVVLHIPRETHRRLTSRFGVRLWELVDGAEQTTWNAAGTSVSYREDSGEITLTTTDPYDGGVIFFGV